MALDQCFVKIAQGWGGANCEKKRKFPTLVTKVVDVTSNDTRPFCL